MPEWKKFLSESITSAEELAKFLDVDKQEVKEVTSVYPMKINRYFLGLIKQKNDALWRQSIPSIEELKQNVCVEDPLHEEQQSPVKGLVHRYPDRVLLLVSNNCAMFCRFCTRKRKIGHSETIKRENIIEGIEYIRKHKEIRDVLLSGGDPLLLDDKELDWILGKIRAIKHVEIIRIGTRVPCSLPMRITKELCEVLKKYHPLFVNMHFNHSQEITEETRKACNLLAEAGIPLGNQTVLLKGVNDSGEIIAKLNKELLKMRVRPYYLYQADLVKGTNHFRTKTELGIKIIESLRGHISGLAVPHFAIDAPGGGGKITIAPNYVLEKTDKKIILRNYENKCFEYPEPE